MSSTLTYGSSIDSRQPSTLRSSDSSLVVLIMIQDQLYTVLVPVKDKLLATRTRLNSYLLLACHKGQSPHHTCAMPTPEVSSVVLTSFNLGLKTIILPILSWQYLKLCGCWMFLQESGWYTSIIIGNHDFVDITACPQQYFTVLCYHLYLVFLLFAVLLSLHLVIC